MDEDLSIYLPGHFVLIFLQDRLLLEIACDVYKMVASDVLPVIQHFAILSFLEIDFVCLFACFALFSKSSIWALVQEWDMFVFVWGARIRDFSFPFTLLNLCNMYYPILLFLYFFFFIL